MTSRKTSIIRIATILLAVSVLPACRTQNTAQVDQSQTGPSPVVIPTWTALSQEEQSPVVPTPTLRMAGSPTNTATPGTAVITVRAVNGNMNVRRGPGIDYNATGVLTDGEMVIAIGRDRIRRWLYVEYPTGSGTSGWVSVLTAYTEIEGDIDDLPVIAVDPAAPAFIRNCTKHTLWVFPARVELLPKTSEPYNEERFPPGAYQIFDLDVSSDETIDEINLREGLLVEVIRDGNDEKSKCK